MQLGSVREATMDAQKAIPAAPTTFLQRLSKKRNALGNMALAAACCILATRIIGQDNELRAQRASNRASEGYYKAEVDRMKLENIDFQQKVRDELGKGTSNLVQRLEAVLEAHNAARQASQDDLEGTPQVLVEASTSEPKKSGKFMV